MALDGKLCLALRPKNYSAELEKWKTHEETLKLNETIASVEAIAKENKKNVKIDNQNQEDSFDDENDSNDDDPNYAESDSYKNCYRHFESTDEKEKHESTNDTDASNDTSNKYKLLSINN